MPIRAKKTTTLGVLRAVQRRLATKGWVRGTAKRGERMCLGECLNWVPATHGARHRAIRDVAQMCKHDGAYSIVDWNDISGRKYDHVKTMLKKVIAKHS